MAGRKKSDRVQIGLRLREEMRSKLEAAAKEHGYSINAEIESRLERSFWDEEARQAELHYMFQGRYNYAIALALAGIAGQLSDQVFAPWTENEWIYRQVREAFDTFLDGIAPPPNAAATGGRFVPPVPENKMSGKEVAKYWLKILPLIATIRRKRLAQGSRPLEPYNLREVAYQVAQEIVPLIGRKVTNDE